MRVAVAADHEGFRTKDWVIPFLEELGHEVMDLGTHSREPVDHPDLVPELGRLVRDALVERGVLITGSACGAAISANKARGLRAAVCHDPLTAQLGVEEDDVNVLCVDPGMTGAKMLEEILASWLEAQFSNIECHRRRVEKSRRLERDAA